MRAPGLNAHVVAYTRSDICKVQLHHIDDMNMIKRGCRFVQVRVQQGLVRNNSIRLPARSAMLQWRACSSLTRTTYMKRFVLRVFCCCCCSHMRRDTTPAYVPANRISHCPRFDICGLAAIAILQ